MIHGCVIHVCAAWTNTRATLLSRLFEMLGFFFFNIFIGVELLYTGVLVSAVLTK